MRWNRLVRLGGVVAIGTAGLTATGFGAASFLGGSAVAGATTTCTAVPSTGLTAAVVATVGEVIATVPDATGCGVGVYVGPTATGVTITGATISGASDEGILAQDTSALTVEGSTITGNGIDPSPGLDSTGGIVLVGVTDSTVGGATPLLGNSVTNNDGGGILVNDDGVVDPGAPNPGSGPPVDSSDVTVSNNTISANFGSCGIVYATHNTGGTISGGVITDNTITGTGTFRNNAPDLGGIVVAAASVGATVSNTQVTGNHVSASFEGGIIVHSHAPNDVVTGTAIEDNFLQANAQGIGNNWGRTNGPPTTAGLIIGVDVLPAPIAPKIEDTTVLGNTISGQFYGVWISGVPGVSVPDGTVTPGVRGAVVPDNTITTLPGGTQVYNTPVPGTGYWQVASDGGVFTYGSAGFYGSTGNIKLNSPIVGMAPTQDQGGYWLVAADGGVFSFGDAPFFGSAGGTASTHPFVGMAATPYVPGAGGAPASPAGLGYWLVTSNGAILNYGDAGNFGSAINTSLNRPIVGITPTPDGKGYWLVASDGGVFSYGDAVYYGSTGGIKLNQPIVGMAATPDGKGYWLVAADGGVFSFGDAVYHGSTGNIVLNKPVVGMTPTPDGGGYWLHASDGGVFSFGDAVFYGSSGGIKLNQPVVGAAAVGITTSG
jgi:Right handed beta helix region